MKQALKYDFIPFEEYLAGEREAKIRSEYVDGRIYAMAGASETHNTIAGSFYAFIESRLKEGCRVWQSDMKLAVRKQGRNFGYYPDIMAACGENSGDPYTRTDPILIVEVLSDSTERVDLKEKFDNYTSIPTLLEYVVVAQDAPLVRLFRRRTSWERETYRAEDVFRLESAALDVPVRHIYRRVRKEVGLDVGGGARL
jgi:Uma2 family endonuclease